MQKNLFASSALILLLVNCGGHIPPNPNPTTYSLSVQTVPIIKDVTLKILDNQNSNRTVITNELGKAIFDNLIGPSAFTVCANKLEYKEHCFSVTLVPPQSTHQLVSITLEALPPVIVARKGQVRSDGFSLIDDSGKFLGLGTSLFWGLWGFEHDLIRLEQNLKTARDANIDYIRVFAIVGPKGWSDRIVNANKPNWQENIANFTNLVYDKYGMRVEWTIFASVDLVPSAQSRLAVTNKFLDAIQEIHTKILGIEIANEAWNIGYNNPTEIKSLARLVESRYPGLVATTSPQEIKCNVGESENACYCRGQNIWYSANETFITNHFDRSISGSGGRWRPIRQPWRGSSFSCSGNTKLYSNDEGIGPQSSVVSDDDPLRLALYASTSYTAGIALFTLHTGAGIRGGGIEDRNLGRVANLWEVNNWNQITKALNYVRNTLNPNLPNWTKGSSIPSMFNVQTFDSNNTLGSVDRVYCANSTNEFSCSILNIRSSTNLIPNRTLDYKIIDPINQNVKPGTGNINLVSPPGVIINGNFH